MRLCFGSILDFPIGGKTPLDADTHTDYKPWEQRWEVPLHLWDGLFCQRNQTPPPHLREDRRSFEILQKLSAVMRKGYEEDYLQRQPHTILLDMNFYKQSLLPVLADWMVIFLQAQQLGSKSKVPLELCRAYLCRHLPEDEWAKKSDETMVVLNKLQPLERKLLNLTDAWLRVFLPHCLKKVNRVSFGLMNQDEVRTLLNGDPMAARSRIRLAIPFVGKDVPSPAAEFAQPDIVQCTDDSHGVGSVTPTRTNNTRILGGTYWCDCA